MALSYGGDEFAKYFYRGDALAQIAHAVKMVENGGILATNHNRSTTKYYFLHLWRKSELRPLPQVGTT